MMLTDLSRALRTGGTTSTEIVGHALSRIRETDPVVHAVLALDPTAAEQALRSDARRAAGAELGPLDGVPVLVKDNIDTAGLSSTCGSRLMTTPPARDAAIVESLRRAGMVLLGKTNLTEWGNFRSVHGIEGWSAAGGQTRNPHDLDRSPWGSSAGSAVAVATGMAPVALGTETDGSIVCPAGQNGVVGVKPEHGFLPLAGVATISDAQDSVGVLTRSVADAAAVLGVPSRPMSLRGKRFGLWRVDGMPAGVRTLLDDLAMASHHEGAAVVEVDLGGSREILADGLRALVAEFRPSLERYLRGRTGCPATLDDLISANLADDTELSLFGQDLFERAAAVSEEERAQARHARDRAERAARALIDSTLRDNDIDAVLAPANAPAWRLDHLAGDPRTVSSSTPAAVAGYANICLPMGVVGGLPVGISVFGPREVVRLLPLAESVENAVDVRRQAAS
jgi:amidase